MKSFVLVFLLPAVTTFGGSIFTVTDCNPQFNCTTTQTYGDFATTTTLRGNVSSPPLMGPIPAPFSPYEVSQTETFETTFYTSGPPRPGFIDLTYGGFADGNPGPTFYANGSITGLYSWSCFAVGCNNHVFVPVTLGGQFEIVISERSVWVWLSNGGVNQILGGNGAVDYTLQVRDGSMTGPPVTLASSPEPAGQAVIGLLLVMGIGFWRKHWTGSHSAQ
jgi:hypothetical protein